MCRSVTVGWHEVATGGCSAVTRTWGIVGRVSDETRQGPTGRTTGPRRRWGTGRVVCALCAGPGSGVVTEHHLTHGVSVFLCEAHRCDDYQRRRGGRDFAEELAGMWGASGCLAPRHRRAIAAHVRRIASAHAISRLRPGSYSWPLLREEAERRFAAGEPPRKVIFELRATHVGGDAIVPSVRTMRRWFCQARWLATSQPRSRPRQEQRGRLARLSEIHDFVVSVSEPYYSWAFFGSPRGSPRASPGR